MVGRSSPLAHKELDPILVPMPFNQDAYELKDLGLKTGSAAGEGVQAHSPKTPLCFAIEWDDGEWARKET